MTPTKYILKQLGRDGMVWTSPEVFEGSGPTQIGQAVVAGFIHGEPRWAETPDGRFIWGLGAEGERLPLSDSSRPVLPHECKMTPEQRALRAALREAAVKLSAHKATLESAQKAHTSGYHTALAEAMRAKGEKGVAAARCFTKSGNITIALRALGEAFAPILAEWEEKSHELYTAWANRKAELEKAVDTAALNARGALAIGPEREWPGAERWESTYASTNSGAKYARLSATMALEHAQRAGVRGRLIEEPIGPGSTSLVFKVLLEVAEDIDLLIVEMGPSLSNREWVKRCWKGGCQPRVFNPFIPVGYEEQNGLDFFGGETQTKEES